MTTADKALHDLTLALIYLTRLSNERNLKGYWDTVPFSAWKGYDFAVLDKLDEEGFLIDKHRNKSVVITEEGVVKAREILAQYGIQDWEK